MSYEEIRECVMRYAMKKRTESKKTTDYGGMDVDAFMEAIEKMAENTFNPEPEIKSERLYGKGGNDKSTGEKNLEMALNVISKGKAGGKGITCHNCGGKGHMARDCWSKGKGKGGFKGFPKGNYKRKGKGKGRCYNCNQEGHIARFCPKSKGKGKGVNGLDEEEEINLGGRREPEAENSSESPQLKQLDYAQITQEIWDQWYPYQDETGATASKKTKRLQNFAKRTTKLESRGESKRLKK